MNTDTGVTNAKTPRSALTILDTRRDKTEQFILQSY